MIEASPYGAKFRRMMKEPVEIKLGDLLIYYNVYLLDRKIEGYKKVEDLGAQVYKSQAALNGVVNFHRDGLYICREEYSNDSVERLGEAIGILVVNQLAEISGMDWERISQRGTTKKLDYSSATDGARILSLENKGCGTTDTRRKTSAISNAKADIIRKKKDAPDFADVRLGTVVAIPTLRYEETTCWLVDPPSTGSIDDPLVFRLKLRYKYVLQFLELLAPQAKLTVAARTRFQTLESLSDPFSQDKLELPAKLDTFEPGKRSGVWWSDEFYWGKVVVIEKKIVFFLGLARSWASSLGAQSFLDITAKKFVSGSAITQVQCIVTEKTLDGLPQAFVATLDIQRASARDYASFVLETRVFFSSEGLAYAIFDASL